MSINIAAIGPAAVAALAPVATTLVPAIKLEALAALDVDTTTRSLLSTSNVADASATVIDFSTLAQLLAATVVFQTQEAQQAKAIASGTTTNSDFSKLVATASFFVEAFNRFQTSVGALTNSFDSSFDTGFLLAIHTQNVQIGSEHTQSFIDSLAQVGINFNEATEKTNPNQFKIDSQALEKAFKANPAQTTNLLDKALKGLVVIEAKLLVSEPKLDLFTSDFTPALSGAVPASRFDLDMVDANLSKLSSADVQEVNSALQRLLADESLGAAIDATPITSSATSTQAGAVELVGNASTSTNANSGVAKNVANNVANKLDTTSSSAAASVEKLLTEVPTSVRDAVLAPIVVVPDSIAAKATQPVSVSNFDKSPTLPYSSIEFGLKSANLAQSNAKISTVENAVTQTGQDNTSLNAKVQLNTNAETNTNTKRDAVLAPVAVVPDLIAARATQPAVVSNFDSSPTLPNSSIEVGLNSANLARSSAKIATAENAVTQTGQGDNLGNRQDNTSLNAKVQSNTKPRTSAKIQTRQTRIVSSAIDSNAQAAPTRQGVTAASAQADRVRPIVAASRTIATQTDLNSDDKVDAPRSKSVESNTKSGGATRAFIAESASNQLKQPAAASVVPAGSTNDDVKLAGNSIEIDKKSRISNAARPHIQPIQQPANLIDSETSGTKEAPTVQGEAKLTNKSVVTNKDVVTNKERVTNEDVVTNNPSIVAKPNAFPVEDVSPHTTSASVGNVLRTNTSQAIPASAQAAFEYATVQPQATPVNPSISPSISPSINPSVAAAVAAYRLGEIVVDKKSDELASVTTEIVPDVSVIPRIDSLELDPHDGNSDDARIAAALNEVKTSAQRAEIKAAHGQSPPLDSVDVLA
ncbi:hypothetical protein [Undibacterium sp. Ji22W]|uniref:hypothetical protein n=1 Tax=Undibacterium sp. Ji22W TaxID=3413038 RepID=UPI003BF2BC8D